MQQLSLGATDLVGRAVSPFLELRGSRSSVGPQQRKLQDDRRDVCESARCFAVGFRRREAATSYANDVHLRLKEAGVDHYGVRVHGAAEYPTRLRDAEYPIELLYYQGWWELVNSPRSIVIVGTRSPTNEGLSRTCKLVKSLLADDFTIVSGLAKGIDAEAHRTAIKEGGRTIAGARYTPVAKLSARECQSAKGNCRALSADLSGTGDALRATGESACKPFTFSRSGTSRCRP